MQMSAVTQVNTDERAHLWSFFLPCSLCSVTIRHLTHCLLLRSSDVSLHDGNKQSQWKALGRNMITPEDQTPPPGNSPKEQLDHSTSSGNQSLFTFLMLVTIMHDSSVWIILQIFLILQQNVINCSTSDIPLQQIFTPHS